MKRIDLTGVVFGTLTVIEKAGALPPPSYCSLWRCRCQCGVVTVVRAGNLRSGNTTSCGCLGSRKHMACIHRTHGLTKTKEYQAYHRMIARCYRTSGPDYPDYGGRGICVYDGWRGDGGFERFLACIGSRPTNSHSLDRIDVNGNYEPGNVRWATIKQQMRNQRKTIMLTIDGITKALTEWAEVSRQKPSTIHARLNHGWNPNEAVFHETIGHGYTRKSIHA